MTRYKLPACLGGGEFDAAVVVTTKDGTVAAMFDLPGLDHMLALPLWALTEIPPVVPPEPEPGAWQIGEYQCLHGATEPGGWSSWIWTKGATPRADGSGWTSGGWGNLWAEIGGPDVSIVRLVPESSDRAQPSTVDLPWTYRDAGGDSTTIGVTTNHTLRVGRVPYVEVIESDDLKDPRRAAAWLDSHEARMGAVAAILAADRAIGGSE